MDSKRNSNRLSILTLTLGPLQTNTYLIADLESEQAVVIDPAWEGESIAQVANEHQWKIKGIWLTHAHFDHMGGAAALAKKIARPVEITLHPDDMPLWRMKGGAVMFGLPAFDPGPEPSIMLDNGMKLNLGQYCFEVLHTPGHTPGHVVFYERNQGVIFCGDLIFKGSVGRTDLPGGDWHALCRSINQQLLVLPDEVRLFSGHGPATTIGVERRLNPFLEECRGV